MRIDDITLRRVLCGVEKPARYAGGELNAVIKVEASFRMAIAFPDLYEVGMSNSGIQVLYSAVNSMDGAACERVFAAAPDLERNLRKMEVPLFTLETRTALRDLDALGFNLSHELLYTGVLQILDLGGIPLLSADRTDEYPLILAGGECASNPAPMSGFVDAFFAGDGEEGIVDMVSALMKAGKGTTREEKLRLLDGVTGVYIPSLRSGPQDGGMHSVRNDKKVRRRAYRSAVPSSPRRPVVPSIRIAQERAVVEITRGCPNLCGFCHAGFYELPYRALDPENVKSTVFSVLENTGYSELTLSSLSVSDYRYLISLLNDIVPDLTRMGVSLSLPSLRVDTDTLPILKNISGVRKSSLTFAVESATEGLRRRANKKLTGEDLKEIVGAVRDMGWKLIKLYFMIGLPGSRDADEAGDIIALLKELHAIGRKRIEFNVTVSPFVPKPHTPFQRVEQRDREYMMETVSRIRRGAPRSVKIKSHDVKASLLEGVMARGDRRLGEVILKSYQDGCRFDSWSEYFRYDVWEANLSLLLPGWEAFLDARKPDEDLHWGVIETGFERLIELRSGECGLTALSRRERGDISEVAIRQAMADFTRRYEVKSRVRMTFSKEGEARYIPHIDLIEIIKRAVRMAEIPVSFTQGFNKRERIAAGFPLPLGVESKSEILDLDLWESVDVAGFIPELNNRLPRGIHAVSSRELGTGEKESIMAVTMAVEYLVIPDSAAVMSALLDGLGEERTLMKETKSGKKEVPFADAVLRHFREGDGIILLLKAGSAEAVRVDQAVASLTGLGEEGLCGVRMVKLAQYALRAGEPVVIG